MIKFFYSIPERVVDDTDEFDTSEEAKEARNKAQEQLENNCFGNGLYCDTQNPTSMKEIIRLSCINSLSQVEYFKYINQIHDQYRVFYQDYLRDMLNNGELKFFDFDYHYDRAISYTELTKIEIDRCYQFSFIVEEDDQQKEVPRYKQDNYLLSWHHTGFESLNNHSQLPFVILNNQEILSSSKNYTADVLKSLCEVDGDIESKICSGLYKIKKNKNRGLNTGEIILIVMGSLAASVLLCYFAARYYNRYQKRRYSNELERVDSLVSAYIELNSDQEKKQTNT